MDEALRHEIVQRHQAGVSVRAIARDLGISRGAVARTLARVQAQRAGRPAPASGPRARPSIVDPFEPLLKELLAQYPNLTVERALQELRQRGFTGSYTVVRCAGGPRPCRALGPGQVSKRRWTIASTLLSRLLPSAR